MSWQVRETRRKGKALLDYYRTGDNPIYSAEAIASAH
jgi:hypothetical protein